jgi:segregation and condensation protein B
MDYELQKQVVEALIFATDVPISESKVSSILEEITPAQAKKIVEELNSEYSQFNRSFFITRVAGGFQFNTRKDLSQWIKKLYRGKAKPRLSQAGLETLAIISFKQPISRVEVDAIRGVHSGGVIKNLLERNLVAIAGRAEGAGKPLLYATTKEFLRYLGINDVSELPKPKEIEEIMGKLREGDEGAQTLIDALAAVEEDDESGDVAPADEPEAAKPEVEVDDSNGKAQ